jgi:hypothetical protein
MVCLDYCGKNMILMREREREREREMESEREREREKVIRRTLK